MNRIALWMVVACAALAACSVDVIKPGAELSPKPGKGIVVVSFLRSGSIDAEVDIKLRAAGGHFRSMLVLDDWRGKRDWSQLASKGEGFSAFQYATQQSPIGHLAVLELPAGDYEFYQWQGNTFDVSRISPDYYMYSDDFVVRFKVVPGRITYVGGLQLELPDYISPGLMKGNFRLHAVAPNERDLAVLRTKYPLAAAASIDQVALVATPAMIEGEFNVYSVNPGDHMGFNMGRLGRF